MSDMTATIARLLAEMKNMDQASVSVTLNLGDAKTVKLELGDAKNLLRILEFVETARIETLRGAS